MTELLEIPHGFHLFKGRSSRQLPFGQRHRNVLLIGKLLRQGLWDSEVARRTGANRMTVARLRNKLARIGVTFKCPCGKPSHHQAACEFRPVTGRRRQDLCNKGLHVLAENSYVWPNGRRCCRICKSNTERARRNARKR